MSNNSSGSRPASPASVTSSHATSRSSTPDQTLSPFPEVPCTLPKGPNEIELDKVVSSLGMKTRKILDGSHLNLIVYKDTETPDKIEVFDWRLCFTGQRDFACDTCMLILESFNQPIDEEFLDNDEAAELRFYARQNRCTLQWFAYMDKRRASHQFIITDPNCDQHICVRSDSENKALYNARDKLQELCGIEIEMKREKRLKELKEEIDKLMSSGYRLVIRK